MHSLKTLGGRNAWFAALLAALLAACGGGSSTTNESSDGIAVDGEALVGVRAGTLGSASVEGVIASAGSVLMADAHGSFYRVALGAGLSFDDAAKRLVHPDIVYVERNYLAYGYAAPAPNDPAWATSQYSAKVRAEIEAAWDAYGAATPTGAVKLAILDTGVATGHEDLSRVNVGEWKDWVTLANTVAGDDNGHGTQLAGIAAADPNNSAGIAGIATWTGSATADPALSVSIMPVKVADRFNVSNHAAIAAGVNYAVNNGANVILLSLGSVTPSWTLQNAVQAAKAAGVLVVAAAGNDATASARYPAAYQATNQGVLSVSSATAADALDTANKANFGSWVNVLAPGAGLTSTNAGGAAVYANGLAGSSYAAAHVAGAAAVLWSLYGPSATHATGKLTVDELRYALLAGLDSYDRATSNAINGAGGRFNMEKALAAAAAIQGHAAGAQLPGSVVFNATAARGGVALTGTVVLTAPAGAGGTVVTLASDRAVLRVPASVTVLNGSRYANFAISTDPVAAATTATVTATAGGVSATGTIDLTTPGISRVTLSPASVVGGATASGSVALAGPAPTGGVVVTLSDASTDTSFVSTTVTVPAGQSSATIGVRTGPVASQKSVVVTASANGTSATATLTIKPVLGSASFTPSSLRGGANTQLKVLLNAAQAADVVVDVAWAGSTTQAFVDPSPPTTVLVAKGQTSATVTIATKPVAAASTVTATASYGGFSATAATVTVTPPAIQTLSASTNALIWWDATHVTTGSATVTLDANVSADTLIYVGASDGTVAVPGTVTVLAGTKTATFVVTPAAVVTQGSVTLSASYTSNFAVKKTATVTLKPALSAASLASAQVAGGATVKGTVTLSAAAPAGNFAVSVASDNAQVHPDPTVTVTAGNTTAQFNVTTDPSIVPTTATITVTVNGVSKALALKLTSPVLSTVTFSPTSAFVGDSVTGTVTLDVAAVSTTGVALTSSDTTAIPLAANYVTTVAKGATTATFTFTAGTVSTQKSVTVTARLNGASKTGTLTVKPKSVVAALGSASVFGGVEVSGTVTLPANAPAGGTVVTLASSDPAAVVSTSTVTVAAGSKTATFYVHTLGVDADKALNVTATTGGYTSTAALTVKKYTTYTLTDAGTPIAGGAILPLAAGASKTIRITLNALAGPTNGAATMSSSIPAIASVNAGGVQVSPQSNWATFNVTMAGGAVPGDATIISVTVDGVPTSFAVLVP